MFVLNRLQPKESDGTQLRTGRFSLVVNTVFHNKPSHSHPAQSLNTLLEQCSRSRGDKADLRPPPRDCRARTTARGGGAVYQRGAEALCCRGRLLPWLENTFAAQTGWRQSLKHKMGRAALEGQRKVFFLAGSAVSTAVLVDAVSWTGELSHKQCFPALSCFFCLCRIQIISKEKRDGVWILLPSSKMCERHILLWPLLTQIPHS